MTEQETSVTNEEPSNYASCRLIHLHLPDFYHNIYLPYKYFRNGNWDIVATIKENTDILFYSEDYMTADTIGRFHKVFDKLSALISTNLSDLNLYHYLRDLTDDSDPKKWRVIHKHAYLKRIMTDDDYENISPEYITKMYLELCEMYPKDRNMMGQHLTVELDCIVEKGKSLINMFRRSYRRIVDAYVYYHPLVTDNAYTIAFVNKIMIAILDVASELINLHIYGIHPLITEIIDYYLPLDDINLYEKGALCIV